MTQADRPSVPRYPLFNHIAQSLADLLRQAEANEVSYLAFAESLVTEELRPTGGGST